MGQIENRESFLKDIKELLSVMEGNRTSEQATVLGEIRDQLKRIADLFQSSMEGQGALNVEIGEPIVKIRKLPEK